MADGAGDSWALLEERFEADVRTRRAAEAGKDRDEAYAVVVVLKGGLKRAFTLAMAFAQFEALHGREPAPRTLSKSATQLSKDILGLVAAHLGLDVTPGIIDILQGKVTRSIGGPTKKGRNETPIPCPRPTKKDWRALIASGRLNCCGSGVLDHDAGWLVCWRLSRRAHHAPDVNAKGGPDLNHQNESADLELDPNHQGIRLAPVPHIAPDVALAAMARQATQSTMVASKRFFSARGLLVAASDGYILRRPSKT